MQSKASTVEAYLAELPAEQREVISAVRAAINRNLDKDFREGMGYGMIGWAVPHEVFPAGYHCDPSKPLMFAGLASQKSGYSLYLMCLYQDAKRLETFKRDWARTGKKLDMGKSCIRFKKLEDLPLEVVGEMVHGITAREYAAQYAKLRAEHVPMKREEIKKRVAQREAAQAATKKPASTAAKKATKPRK